MSVQEAITHINRINGREFSHSKLEALAITEKPAGALTRTFTAHIKYASGREETATSAPMVWQ